MKKFLIAALATLMLASCGEKKFHVEGTITNAKDSVLYFENIGLAGPEVIDSVSLSDSGDFAFAGAQTASPEFYRLRISDQIISLCIDSTETVTVKAQYPQMASQYEVSGSDDCAVIKELALLQMDLQQRAIKVSRDETLDIDQINDSILAMIGRYKQDVKMKYIFPHPDKPYAYFALFQALGNMLLFNPRTDKDDIKAFAAVATSWDTYWPDAERGKNLHNIAIEGMKNIRILQQRQLSNIDPSLVNVSNVIDINLPDNKGQQRRLTDLKGKVVLLDFHVFASEGSTARIMQLRDIYNKFHAQGLEIYQVSLDSDEHFWKTQTAALPWVCVRDERGPQSDYVVSYNIQSIPTFFLLGRNSDLYKRDAQIKDLEAEIRSLL
jgi:hypothetical protein